MSLDRLNPVHVLDSSSLEIVFRELDTFFDLRSYLDEKERAIARYDLLSYCGEEDLLAHYILNYDPTRNRYTIGPSDE